MKKYLLLLIGFLPLFATAQTDLGSGVEKLAGMIGEVQVGKDVFQQELTYSKEKPYLLEFTITQTDSKGRTSSETFSWNLSHIEPNLVKWEDGRDQIKVALSAGRKEYVKKLEDGELDGYDNEVLMLATDIDNARAMVALIKEMIPLAVSAWEADSAFPEEYNALKVWVSQQITSVSFGEDRYKQEWTFSADHPSRLSYFSSKEGDKAVDTENQFNLADINPNEILVKVRGEQVLLELATSGNKRYVRVLENGAVGNYATDVTVLFDDIDEALELSQALKSLVKQAVETQKTYYPAVSSVEAAIAGVQESLVPFELAGTSYKPAMGSGCMAEFTLVTENERGSEEQKYIFNWADLDKGATEVKVKGKEIGLEVQIKGRADYIYLAEDGEQQNYTESLFFPVPDIPTVKQLQHYISGMVDACPIDVQKADWSWLKKEIQEGAVSGEGVTQSVDLLESNNCKWVLEIKEEGKKSQEDRYEFNLYDINPKGVELQISGKKVLIELETVGKAEIIQKYTNAEELGYEDTLTFEVKDVATGKVMIASIMALIEGCKQ
ncbi:MAG: hypothetical protein KDC34_19645 [Saprospiraceae bacterium]|nr:hypothetical protein [Saprospiraceae bacterium]